MKLYVIVLLHESPKHGYEVIDELGKLTGKKPSAGQIYPLFKKLQKKSYVEIVKNGKDERKKKTYKLTKKGRALFTDLTGRFSELMNAAIESRIKACSHCGCSVYKNSHKEKINGRLKSFCCRHCAKSYKSSN